LCAIVRIWRMVAKPAEDFSENLTKGRDFHRGR
jgi:hypothetical protein